MDRMPSDNSLSLTVGGKELSVGIVVAGKMFVFSPRQNQFLVNLQKMKNVMAAALSVGKDEAWGKEFLESRKFRSFLTYKMQEFSNRNGLTVEWWYQFGKWLTEGYKEWYDCKCSYCGWYGELNVYEVESNRTDEMDLVVPCPACYKPTEFAKVQKAFTPSREQVEGWKEMGARLIPKIERVHHQYENTDIIFTSNEGENT